MTDSKRKTKAQLSRIYHDSSWQQSFLKLLNVAGLLRESIIDGGYRIPDDLNNAIYLTEQGTSLAQLLKTKHEVPYKEAKLMCFLVMAYQDFLVDVEKTNYPVLVAEIGRQIKSGDIKHPFAYGRVLYDRAADLFEDQRRYLSVGDTAKLLEGTPRGVWQLGELVTGPFGLLRSRVDRYITPKTRLPLQHCADLSCELVHRVRLTTDGEAPVNLHRPKLSRLLEQGGKEPSDWNGFIDDLVKAGQSDKQADDLELDSLIYLLGDGLALAELRIVFQWLLDETGGLLRAEAARLGLKGSSETIASSMDQAQILQLILYLPDQVILASLDACARGELIEIPNGEIRETRLNVGNAAGPWGLRAALSKTGVSIRAESNSLPMLRLHRLINGLFNTDQVEDMQTLDWQLRHIDAVTPAAKLAEYLRIESPEVAIRNLVLARRENADHACTELGLPPSSKLTDEEIVDAILWKLGFNPRESDSPHSRFFARQKEMMQLAREAQLSSTVDEEPIRRVAAVYFEDLEALLDDSLAFATWGLTNDHYASERPFVFRPSQDTIPALKALSRSSAANSQEKVELGARNNIYPLSRGFAVLADHLEDLRSNADSLKRDPKLMPAYLRHTDLQKFPLMHTHPFLDINAAAQVTIISQLREISGKLVRYDVPETRNDLAHFRRTTVDINKVIGSLEAVADAVRQIDSLCFLRVPYAHSTTRNDRWGRRTVTLANTTGQSVSFTRPSAFDWLPLPGFTREQYLMHSATFAEPNEVLRFTLSYDSPYEDMWTNYPRRRAAKDNSIAKQSESESVTVDSSGRPGTRTG